MSRDEAAAMPVADGHVHLDSFTAEELPGVLEEIAESGIELVVTVGMDASTSSAGLEIARAAPGVYAAVGLHPWNAQDYADGAPVDELRELASDAAVVAIGEIGLDHKNNLFLDLSYEDPALRAIQERVLREQLRLALALELPVIVHSRGGAHDATLDVLDDEGIVAVGGCVQFFEGTRAHVERFTELGFFFTLGSSVTFPDPGGWYETVRAIPDDRVLLETDAPYLPYAGRDTARSRPTDVRVIAGRVAELRGVEPNDVLRASVENLRRALPRVGAG